MSCTNLGHNYIPCLSTIIADKDFCPRMRDDMALDGKTISDECFAI